MALKLPGFIGKVFSVIGKITDVLVKGRQLGLWDKQAGPKIPIKVGLLYDAQTDTQTVHFPNEIPQVAKSLGVPEEAAVPLVLVPPQKYSAWISIEKGLRQAVILALVSVSAAFAGWLMNADAVQAFLTKAGAPEALLGVLVLAARGIGVAISNLNRNYKPEAE